MTIHTARHELRLRPAPDPFRAEWRLEKGTAGLELLHLRLTSDRPAVPPPLELAWLHPLVRTHHLWHPGALYRRFLPPDFEPNTAVTRGTRYAPVMALFDGGGDNALTFALGDGRHAAVLSAGVNEETASVDCRVRLFTEPVPPAAVHELVLRLDTRPLPLHACLRDVADWWAAQPGCAPVPVPEAARLPVYSTWYGFHQRLSPGGIEEQCRLARDYGFASVIVDDGWQTDDERRGYAWCGDWEVAPGKLPGFAAHVRRVQQMGLKYLLWFSAAYVGVRSSAWGRFRGMVLDPDESRDWHVLDPRFSQVREHLAGTWERFVREYNLDGFKLDFIDTFAPPAGRPLAAGGGRDTDSLSEAADLLLAKAVGRLRAVRPDLLLEFRQPYVGPRMRAFANMLRSFDAPADFASNRIHVLDIRLLSGGTPAHADMVMWHPADPVESAALQLLHTLFAVPQVSVLLDRLPADHQAMLRFLLDFWRGQRDVLLDGELEPLAPELFYPVVRARTRGKLLAAVHGRHQCVPLAGELPERIILVNGSTEGRVVVDAERDAGRRRLTVFTCTGERVREAVQPLGAGPQACEVPPAGIAFLDL